MSAACVSIITLHVALPNSPQWKHNKFPFPNFHQFHLMEVLVASQAYAITMLSSAILAASMTLTHGL
jgi:hypothetical protein